MNKPGMVIWLKAGTILRAETIPNNQRARILLVENPNRISVMMLGQGTGEIIACSDICGVELSDKMTLFFKPQAIHTG